LSVSRRELLRTGVFLGAGLFTSCRQSRAQQTGKASMHMSTISAPSRQATQGVQGPPAVPLPSFVTPLSVPPVIRPRAGSGSVSIRMVRFEHKAHRDLPHTTMWGYNGLWPGPTLEVRKGQPVAVRWSNHLPEKHFLPLDYTIHGEGQDMPEVRTVTHLHGARVLPASDGYPDAWVTGDGRNGPVRAASPCQYPNDQSATTLWYHDHALGITRLNVYAGLAGFYLIRDPEEDRLQLPGGAYEVPLMIQDRSFAANGALLYPAEPKGTHPAWMQEFFGNVICVNGKAAPFYEVEPRRYRFRIVNGSNSRFYHLALMPADASGKPSGNSADAPPFIQIGSDGGLLPVPLHLHYLIISPGERFDLVLDFSEHKGASLALINDAPAPYARGGQVVPSEVMLFRVVKPLAGTDESQVPDTLVPFRPLAATEAVRERMLGLSETDRASDGYTMIGLLDQKHWDDPISEDPKAGSTEIWSFLNATGDVHPIHLHLVQFQVLNRQAFDRPTYLQTGKVLFTGIPIAPESNERPAWKDTVKTYSGYITRVIARFDLPTGTSPKPGEEFRYVWHCHVLEHEDNEMMRPYKVIG
jgi:spore coat protein A, manganese oxidase